MESENIGEKRFCHLEQLESRFSCSQLEDDTFFKIIRLFSTKQTCHMSSCETLVKLMLLSVHHIHEEAARVWKTLPYESYTVQTVVISGLSLT